MQKPKSIKELFQTDGNRAAALSARSGERKVALEHVCAVLPRPLADQVVTADIKDGRLIIGMAGAAWAARLRYVTETLRIQVGDSMGAHIHTVRIKVVPRSQAPT